MIITRTPLRLTLGGGGTDLESYYSKYGGMVIATALDKYVYVMTNRMFEDKIRLSYSRTEIVESQGKIEHPVVREALKLRGIKHNIEIVSVADLPSNTGLGSSGSFAVGLLHALHAFNGDSATRDQLAREACMIQMERLRESEGKQDPYVAAFGGLISLKVARSGTVRVERIRLGDDVASELQNSLLFFYTGMKRPSSTVLAVQRLAIETSDGDVIEAMHSIRKIADKVKKALERGDIEEFGRLQDEHWRAKRSIASIMSSDNIDRWYNRGIEAGALGGKLMGAGGGGFLVFCCPASRAQVRKAMAREGLREVSARLISEGTKVIVNV